MTFASDSDKSIGCMEAAAREHTVGVSSVFNSLMSSMGRLTPRSITVAKNVHVVGGGVRR